VGDNACTHSVRRNLLCKMLSLILHIKRDERQIKNKHGVVKYMIIIPTCNEHWYI
jgi:hypothetical protein